MQEFMSDNVEATQTIACDLAATLVGGECIALHGDLGAGKTQFVRGLVQGLGGDGRLVSSPTYVLLNVYPGGDRDGRDDEVAGSASPRLSVYHLDAYRVSGPDELASIGFDELLDQGGVVIVEWAQRVADLLPANRIDVKIEPLGETHRVIRIDGKGYKSN